jgi:hypothetical protein
MVEKRERPLPLFTFKPIQKSDQETIADIASQAYQGEPTMVNYISDIISGSYGDNGYSFLVYKDCKPVGFCLAETLSVERKIVKVHIDQLATIPNERSILLIKGILYYIRSLELPDLRYHYSAALIGENSKKVFTNPGVKRFIERHGYKMKLSRPDYDDEWNEVGRSLDVRTKLLIPTP